MLSISDTATEMVNWVFPEHAGAPGQIHGGRMMQWIATCGTIAASRVARGNVLLGALDDIDFLHPVRVGEGAVLRAQAEYVRRCSLEVGRPEALLFGTTMFAGRLLLAIDEAGGILSMRYCRGLVMTACLDALDFYAPIHANEVVTFKAGLNHVGTTSLEIGVKVLSEVPWTGEVKHACTAYLSFVHLGSDPSAPLRPRPCPSFTPETPAEQRRFTLALERRARRLERVKSLKRLSPSGWEIGMSGHSRWSPTKRTKGKTDVQRGKLVSKI